MADYTPTTEDVRADFIALAYEFDGTRHAHKGDPGREFDRWLAQHDADVAASALESAAEDINDPSKTPFEQYGDPYGWLRNRAAQIRKEANE